MPKRHAVVDGSNLATEGRSEPSLKQLREAVKAFEEEHAVSRITVIVDATFEHRVSTRERKAARTAIDEGELITPPAGVIGRGDAFILEVADKAGAVVLSNDSFQEFHGAYPWLFEQGRLVGGKPVPGVGWVFVARSPVRGPVSRRATAAKKGTAKKQATKKRVSTKTKSKKPAARKPAAKKQASTKQAGTKTTRKTTSNQGDEATAWRRFRRANPVGSSVSATVDRYSSHGAYALSSGLTVYLPTRLLGDPPPPKARDVVSVGETRDFVVHGYDDERLGIDAGLVPAPGAKPAARKTPAKRAAAKKSPAKKAAAKGRPAKKAVSKRAATKKSPAKKRPAKKAAAKKSTAKRTAARRR